MSYDLKESKVGDAVAVQSGWDRSIQKRVIARTTATQVTLDDGTRWTRRGYRVGDVTGGYVRSYARPWNEEEHKARLLESQTKAAQREVERAIHGRLTLEQCRRIIAICKEST